MVLLTGIFDERTRDIVTLLGASGPILLAVIAVLIAGWQVIQGYRHNTKIEQLYDKFHKIEDRVDNVRRLSERNRIYAQLIKSLAVNLASMDSLQEGRLAKMETVIGSGVVDAKRLSEMKSRLGNEYMRVLDEIALLSRSEETRRQAALSLGAGAGNMGTLFLLHELAADLPEHESEAHWKAVAMIRERFLDEERRGSALT